MDPMRLVFFTSSNFHLMYPQHFPLSRLARAMQAPLLLRFFQLLGVCWKSWNPFQAGFRILITPPKINMEPGNDGFQ